VDISCSSVFPECDIRLAMGISIHESEFYACVYGFGRFGTKLFKRQLRINLKKLKLKKASWWILTTKVEYSESRSSEYRKEYPLLLLVKLTSICQLKGFQHKYNCQDFNKCKINMFVI